MQRKIGKYSAKKKRRRVRLVPALLVAAVLLACESVLMLFLGGSNEKEMALPEPSASLETVVETIAETAAAAEETVPAETEPVILPNLAEDASKNPDMVGWIKIEGTKIDYPLMYTPQDPEKYLHKNFNGDFSVGGLPFIDGSCSLDPVSDNLLIYGHNMQNGTMFRALLSYEQESFWQEHPVIRISTLYEEKTYEVIATLYDRVYFKNEEHFKFYQFIDAADQEDFDEAISYFQEHALYDTGVTASYGDKLVTLVTCAYHVDNGRFLVVAREVTDNLTDDV